MRSGVDAALMRCVARQACRCVREYDYFFQLCRRLVDVQRTCRSFRGSPAIAIVETLPSFLPTALRWQHRAHPSCHQQSNALENII